MSNPELSMLAHTAYGKSKVRLVQVARHGDRHDLRDFTVAIQFEGDYDKSYTAGDNSGVLPTDTMKNTVYALAGRGPIDGPEPFALELCRHFLDRNARLERVRVQVTEHGWDRIANGARQHGQAFVRQGSGTRSAAATSDRESTVVEAGLADLVILKSSRSAFSGYMRDEYTSLPETRDRILATSLTATWRYRAGEIAFGPAWWAVRGTLLETFAGHESESVQHTMYAMGRAVMDGCGEVARIHLVMPNRHHLPVDLTPFGLENRNEVFVPTEEPHGLIEATLER
jgi:urate oxidase